MMTEEKAQEDGNMGPVLSPNNLAFIRRNQPLSLIIFLILLNIATGKLLIDHLLKDIEDKQTESLKKDEVIKMWRDLKIETDRAEEYSKRKKDTIYVR